MVNSLIKEEFFAFYFKRVQGLLVAVRKVVLSFCVPAFDLPVNLTLTMRKFDLVFFGADSINIEVIQ